MRLSVIQVTINGEIKNVDSGISIAELLKQLELNSPAIAVEINEQVMPRDSHHQTFLKSGDVLEIVTLVGGG